MSLIQDVKKVIPSPVKQIYRSVPSLFTKLHHIYQSHKDRLVFQHHLNSTDTFLVGHPKSGNTWLAYMLAILVEKDFEHQVTLPNLKQFIPYVNGDDKSISNFSKLHEPRIFRNEWPIYPELYPKVIYLVRDPRSVIPSYFHHYCTVMDDNDFPIDLFTTQYLTGRLMFDSQLIRWDEHVSGWLERSRSQPVLIVRYEDMIDDSRKILEKILEFVGIEYDASLIELAVDRGSFNMMRKHEDTYGSESYTGDMAKRGKFIRSGRRDGWKQELPSESIQAIEEKFGQVMKAVGYLEG